jgi:cytochrome c oxidase subunit 2
VGCHSTGGADGIGPTWKGLFGSQTTLANGSTVTADEAYIRESIVQPNAKVVEGFQPNIMPQTFGNSLTDEQITGLIEYIKTIE